MSSENKVNSTIISSEAELTQLKEFLRINQLPADDITLNGSSFILYRDAENKITGSGGLEFYNQYALLRSLAVSQGLRGMMLGKKIVNDLLTLARERRLKEVYLLTNTASHFFEKFGFTEVVREEVPVEIKASTEFASVCPSSAQVMRLELKS